MTFLHLRMFSMAADYVKFNTDCELIGGYLSPVSDAYRKAGLASAEHRYIYIILYYIYFGFFEDLPLNLNSAADKIFSIAMCRLAVDKTSDWLMVDTWEPLQKEYQPTAVVLDHFDYEINTVRGGVDVGHGKRKPVRVALLAGADLVHTMSTPGVWSQRDLDHILGRYGVRVLAQWNTFFLSYRTNLLLRHSSSSAAGQTSTRR